MWMKRHGQHHGVERQRAEELAMMILEVLSAT